METAIRVLSHINSTRPEFQRAWAEQMELIALIGSKEEVAQVLAKAKVVAGEDVYRNLSRFLKEKSSPGGDEDVNAASAPFESYRRRHDAIERYLQLFSGREDCFARQWVNKPEGKQGYVPVRRPLEPADIEEHLRGNKTYGMYLLDSDSQVRTAVIEMKEKRPVEMKPAISRAFISAYEEMMKRNVMYRPLNKKISYRWLILQQVRSFSKYLVGPEKIYRPFLWER